MRCGARLINCTRGGRNLDAVPQVQGKQGLLWMPLISWTKQHWRKFSDLWARRFLKPWDQKDLYRISTIVRLQGCHGGSTCVGEKETAEWTQSWTWCCFYFVYSFVPFLIYLFFPSASKAWLCLDHTPDTVTGAGHTETFRTLTVTVQLTAFRIRSFLFFALRWIITENFQRANYIKKRAFQLLCLCFEAGVAPGFKSSGSTSLHWQIELELFGHL